ncbi:CDGSH iron-sulfur domain-containing protein [Miltoncostaea marina]|uniref:CDGSH iron-sulfur domain-containing protein n=1 Tax=Miltoncostaea marina TaxID=2843215 RepID=UPI001C3DA35E|nr:CDGSH iron-sulfur domain-containing protein [Miltoncostaea marina]
MGRAVQATSVDPEGLAEPDERPCSIGAYPDGPLLVRGSFDLLGPDGERIAVRRRTIALCRCGRTRTAPFCDGTHKAAGFTTRTPAPARPPDAAAAVAAAAPASPRG